MLRVWGERYVSYCYYCLEKSTPTGATKHSVSAKNEECVLMREENQACAFVEGKLSPQSFLNSMRSCNNNKDEGEGTGVIPQTFGNIEGSVLHKSSQIRIFQEQQTVKQYQVDSNIHSRRV